MPATFEYSRTCIGDDTGFVITLRAGSFFSRSTSDSGIIAEMSTSPARIALTRLVGSGMYRNVSVLIPGFSP